MAEGGLQRILCGRFLKTRFRTTFSHSLGQQRTLVIQIKRSHNCFLLFWNKPEPIVEPPPKSARGQQRRYTAGKKVPSKVPGGSDLAQ
jgi:hypothetical protein